MTATATMTSKFLLTAAAYKSMFADIVKQFPTYERRINEDIAWAKRVLKKNDRIVWWLRWLRLSMLHTTLDIGVFAPSSEQETSLKTLLHRELESYNRKAQYTYTYGDIPNTYEMGGQLQLNMEHYFGIASPEFQNYQPGYESPNDTVVKLAVLEEKWRERQKSFLQPQDGDEIILEVGEGAWWKLSRGYCPQEGSAMGHCGNGGSACPHEETILSYRQPVTLDGQPGWKPNLTFILDDRDILGEMKGRNNTKPSPKYHPAIVALLESNYVRGIKGGGYKPECNFDMTDLPEKERDKLYEDKPSLMPVDMQFKRQGMNSDLAERVVAAVGEQTLRWDEESSDDRFVILSPTWYMDDLCILLGDKFAENTERYARLHKVHELVDMSGYKAPDWAELIPHLSTTTQYEMETIFEDDLDEQDPSDDDIKTRLTAVIRDMPDTMYRRLIDQALKRTALDLGMKKVSESLTAAVERSGFRIVKRGDTYWKNLWGASVSSETAVAFADGKNPLTTTRYKKRLEWGEIPSSQIRIGPEYREWFSEVDWKAAAADFATLMHDQYRTVKLNERSREQYARSKASALGQTPGDATLPPTRVMYHVSRTSNRVSIQKNGLIPQVKEFVEIEREPGVYLMETREQGYDWAWWFGWDAAAKIDLWEVTLPEGVPVRADMDDDMDIFDAWIVSNTIPSSHLKLIQTLGPKYPWNDAPPKSSKIIRDKQAALTPQDRTLYHGTNSAEVFTKFKPNQYGLIWLAEKEVAGHYSAVHFRKGEPRTYEVTLLPEAKIVDLRDPSTSIAQKLKADLEASLVGFYGIGYTMSDEEYMKRADFGLLECYPWVRRLLKSRRIDAVIVNDHGSGMANVGQHESMAVLNPKIIVEASEKKVASAIPGFSYEQFQADHGGLQAMVADLELGDWSYFELEAANEGISKEGAAEQYFHEIFDEWVGVYRATSFPCPVFRMMGMDDISSLRTGGVGIFWSWAAETAQVFWDRQGQAPKDYLFQSVISEQMVDWSATLFANMNFSTGECEKEVTLKPGTALHLTGYAEEPREGLEWKPLDLRCKTSSFGHTSSVTASSQVLVSMPTAAARAHEYGYAFAAVPANSSAAQFIADLHQAIDPADLAGKGLEAESHITVRYGIKGTDVAGMVEYLSALPPFTVKLGETDSFPPTSFSEGATPLIIPVESPELHQIHEQIAQHGDFSTPNFEFRPHITIAYIAPESVNHYLGLGQEGDHTLRVDRINVSDAADNETVVELTGDRMTATSPR